MTALDPNTLPAGELPALLQPIAERHLEALGDALAEWQPFSGHLRWLFACSDFIARSLQQPGLLAEMLAGELSAARNREVYRQRVQALLDGAEESAAMAGLRHLRRAEMVRIAWRDLAGLAADLNETLRELTWLSEACVDGAFNYAHERLADKHGRPRNPAGDEQRLVVLGMGKMGGEELNFSSDIDLILAYPEAGMTGGRRALDNGQFFTRVGQLAIRLLDELTADGFVFRVDMRLRPFGSSGPLAMNYDGLEAYYLTQGREWERYAMIKSRVVSSEPNAEREFQALLRPFVYRRYLDYGAFDALRDLKRKIAGEVARKGKENNIKLGHGGIREIEFIGQSFQLVRGGQEQPLQQRGIQPVLQYLGQAGHMSPEDTDFLLSAYALLRRVENRLQMLGDQQLHDLPLDPLGQARLSLAMHTEWPTLAAEIEQVRARVSQLFESVFSMGDDDAEEDQAADALAQAWSDGADTDDLAAAVSAAGMPRAAEIAVRLHDLRHGPLYTRLSSRAADRLGQIIPLLLHHAAERDPADATFERMLGIVRTIAGRSVYLQLMIDNPPVLSLLADLCAASKSVAQFIEQHPVVIDELLDSTPHEPLTRDDIEQQARLMLRHIDRGDLEQLMDRMRQFRQSVAMRIAVADVKQLQGVMSVSDQLTWLAEVVLQLACELVWDELVKKHGEPACQDRDGLYKPGFSVVAYGKMGSLELGYASDLDIVFLHDSHGKQQFTSGEKSLDNGVFFGRMAQKVVHFLTTLTAAGTLYETDTRLRPNGKSGLLVSSLEAFREYQLSEAWTWEHQALVRARVVVGSQRLRDRFDVIRTEVLGQRRDHGELRQQVREMRERMRRELSRGNSELFDLKQGHGGIADIEFVVQYLVLAHVCTAPELMLYTDNVRLLSLFAEAGLMPADEAELLHEQWLNYRVLVHRRALRGEKSVLPWTPALTAAQAQVAAVWQRIMVD